ncbi:MULTISPECIES: CAAD domain-containing protein [Nostocales]|jgi:hypothetical protein|nr:MULTISPECIES: CAAD domain-containing protein [Nostocales]MCX5982703.1 CAAD domain-containing protein [Nostocales cyanobacterium LacPavin_0920_SED1_MAG_38_18]
MMETQAQQPEQGNYSPPQSLPELPAAKESASQWQQIIRKIVEFLNRLPDDLGSFFNNNKQGLITVALILSAFVTVKVAIALLDAVNDLPLLQPILELIGLFYSIWFSFRYLLKYETRQELAQKFNAFKQQSLG